MPRVILLALLLILGTSPVAFAQQTALQQPGGIDNDRDRVDVVDAIGGSLKLLPIEHGFRLAFQERTRAQLRGPFWKDFARSVRIPDQWDDSDSWIVNYIGHPIHGAAAGYVWLDHEPGAPSEISLKQRYWVT